MVVAQLLVPLLLLNSSLEVLSHGLEDVAGHGDVLAGYKDTVSFAPIHLTSNSQSKTVVLMGLPSTKQLYISLNCRV